MNSGIIGFTATHLQMAIIATQYLRGRKLRTALTTLAVVFGVALIFAINIILPSAMEAFNRMITATSGTADLSITSATGEAFLPDEPVHAVEQIGNVRAAAGVLRRQITLPASARKGQGAVGNAQQIEVVGVDPSNIRSVREFAVSEGRFLEPGDSEKAVVPAGIAEVAPEFKVGTQVSLITAGGVKSYTIVGFVADKVNPAAPQIIVPLADAQAAFNQPGLVNVIDVGLRAGAERDAVAAEIEKALGTNYRLDAPPAGLDTLASLEIGYAVLNLMGLLALFLGAFLIFNTFRTVAVERRRDLAMLRAIGATSGQLSQMIMIESLIQGVVGTGLGLILGYSLALLMSNYIKQLLTEFSVHLDLSVSLNAPAVIGATLLGVATTLVAGYWPARTVGRISPLESLRQSSAPSIQRSSRRWLATGIVMLLLGAAGIVTSDTTVGVGILLFLAGLVIAAPGFVVPAARLFSPLLAVWFAREGDLARGNLVRQPGRAAITGGTLMVGLAVLIAMVAIVAGFDRFMTNMVNRNFASDILLTPPTISLYGSVVGADDALTERLQTLPQVETVSGLRYAAGSYNAQRLEVLGIDPDTYPKVGPLQFVAGKPEDAYAALSSGRNAIVNSLTALGLQLQVGDEFVIQTAEGPRTYRVVGVGDEFLTFKLNAVFISHENLSADFHKADDVMLMVNLKPGADRSAALADVQQILADYPQFTARLTGEYRQMLVDTSVGALRLFYALALLILIPSALGLLNTLTINVLERTREIGVVRAVGASRGQVRRIVTAEALLLGLFGAAMGTLAGVALSYGVTVAIGGIGWNMPYEFPAIGIVAAVVVGVMVALFSSILPARHAAQLDIIRALQYE